MILHGEKRTTHPLADTFAPLDWRNHQPKQPHQVGWRKKGCKTCKPIMAPTKPMQAVDLTNK